MITSVKVPDRKAAILLAAPLFAAFPGELNLSSQQAFHIANQAWMIWAIWWLAMAFFSKSTKRRESVIQRIEHLVPAFLGFLLIFRRDFAGAWLVRPVFSANSLLLLICVVATILGLLFAVWARLTLGSNWSGTVTIKTNHQLIRRGPYRWIRHPIYTGMLAAQRAGRICIYFSGAVSKGAPGRKVSRSGIRRGLCRTSPAHGHVFAAIFVTLDRHFLRG
jgi:protein-S-isoprenylcysteine O-methyltransferase Ste14